MKWLKLLLKWAGIGADVFVKNPGNVVLKDKAKDAADQVVDAFEKKQQIKASVDAVVQAIGNGSILQVTEGGLQLLEFRWFSQGRKFVGSIPVLHSLQEVNAAARAQKNGLTRLERDSHDGKLGYAALGLPDGEYYSLMM